MYNLPCMLYILNHAYDDMYNIALHVVHFAQPIPMSKHVVICELRASARHRMWPGNTPSKLIVQSTNCFKSYLQGIKQIHIRTWSTNCLHRRPSKCIHLIINCVLYSFNYSIYQNLGSKYMKCTMYIHVLNGNGVCFATIEYLSTLPKPQQ